MYRILVLLLIIIPAAEIAVLILSGNYLGFWVTVGLVILTGVIGAWLAKKEGLHTLRVAQLQMQNREVPSGIILDGLCILVGGVLLLTPGFITDFIGFYLLIPKTRHSQSVDGQSISKAHSKWELCHYIKKIRLTNMLFVQTKSATTPLNQCP